MNFWQKKIKIWKYNSSLRNKLKNHDFSIISMDCTAGIIYNRLDQRFLSPTINLWFKGNDFVTFCEHLSEYLQCELEFIESEKNYPVGILKGGELPDIKIYFMHYSSREEAYIKWMDRRNRVNFHNLYIIAKDSEMDINDIARLEKIQCKNKVIFTSKDYPDFSHTFFLNKYSGMEYVGKYLNDRDELGISYVEHEFDFVDFLNN